LADVVGARDVFYVLLAICRACPLLTCDLRLARAAARLGVEVIAVDRAEPAEQPPSARLACRLP
jgi:hypothetical protein